MNTIKKGFYAVASTVLVLPFFVNAIDKPKDNFGANQVVYGGGGDNTLIEIIAKIITFLLGFVGALAVLGIIVSGIWYITSGGDEGRVETAKKWLIFSVIGLVVALLGWVIVNTVITGLEK